MLRGRRALVSGASQGIGKAIALTLARRGANVAVNYKSAAEQSAAEEVVELCRTFCAPSGGSSIAVRADVSRGAEVRGMFEQLDAWAASFPSKVASSGYVDGPTRAAAVGPAVDILVNNAGTQTWKRLLEIEEEEWDDVLGTNAKGAFLCTQAAALRMRDTGAGGSVINIGSGCNHVPFPMLSSYTASKGAIEAWTKVAAVELGPHNIRVNCVAPGAIETERTKAETGDYAQTWAPLTPLRRVGQPEDVADAVTYLASDSSRFITGQTLSADGERRSLLHPLGLRCPFAAPSRCAAAPSTAPPLPVRCPVSQPYSTDRGHTRVCRRPDDAVPMALRVRVPARRGPSPRVSECKPRLDHFAK